MELATVLNQHLSEIMSFAGGLLTGSAGMSLAFRYRRSVIARNNSAAADQSGANVKGHNTGRDAINISRDIVSIGRDQINGPQVNIQNDR